MSQINALVNAARAVVQTTGSAAGVSAANANLVAVAGALSGMQLSGYEVINPQMFAELPDPMDAVEALGSMASDAPHYIPSSFQYQGVDQGVFDGLVDPNTTFDFQNFFFASPISMQAAQEIFQFDQFALESNSLCDPNNPEGESESDATNHHNANERREANPEEVIAAIESNLPEDSGSFGSAMGQLKGSIGQAASTVTSSTNYASSLSNYGGGYGNGSGYLVEPSGFVYLSSGSGDVVQGSPYADTLFGSTAGGDTLVGGSGSDAYAIYASTTQIIEDVNGGVRDSAFIAVNNYQGTSGVERVAILNTQAYVDHTAVNSPYLTGIDSGWRINGSVDSQTVVGSYGADILNGGGGADLLIGGAGDDVYMYTGSETIVELSNQGHDIVRASASVTLANHIETAVAVSAAGDLNITGNALDNLLVGNEAANNLSGGAGTDTLVGNGGDDVYTGGAGADTFILNGQDSFMGEIIDFQSGQDHLALINSDPSVTLSMAPSDGFTGVAGQLLLIDGGLQVDWNGDAMFDSILLINEAPVLADFSIIDPHQTPYF